MGFRTEEVHISEDLCDLRRLAPHPDHRGQSQQPILPDGIASNASIASQRDEQVPRAFGQRAENRRLHPEVGGIAQKDRPQDRGAVRPVKFSHRQRELVAHPDGRVLRHQPELVPYRLGKPACLDQLLGEQDRMLPHSPIHILQANEHMDPAQCAQAFKGMQSMHAREGDAGVGNQIREDRHRFRVPPLVQQPRRGIPFPAVRTRERSHQLGCLRLAELHGFGRLEIHRHNAVNAPLLVAIPPVDDVKRAFRAVDKLHRAKAHIRRGDELGVGIVYPPARVHLQPRFAQYEAMNDVG